MILFGLAHGFSPSPKAKAIISAFNPSADFECSVGSAQSLTEKIQSGCCSRTVGLGLLEGKNSSDACRSGIPRLGSFLQCP